MSRRVPGSCLRSRRSPATVLTAARPARTTARTAARTTVLTTGLAGVLAAALAGCGSLEAPGTADTTATASPSGAAPSPAGGSPAGTSTGTGKSAGGGPGAMASTCPAAGLRIRLDIAAAGVAAGSYYVPLEFTNTTGKACQLAGFPAVAFTSGRAGQQIGPEAAVDGVAQPAAVALAPGATAHAWLQVLAAASYPASKCHPVTAAGLRVEAPGTQSASYVAHRVPACKAALAGSQILTVHPVQPGRARRGTA
jgi:hypothetical protein